MKKIFFLMRYSVLLDTNSWNIARNNNQDEYKEKLFEHNRLKHHHHFFSNLMLESLKKQVHSDVEVKLIIATSSELPEFAKKDLYKSVDDLDWVEVIEIEKDANLNKSFNECLWAHLKGLSCTYITIRIDDDDALSKLYTQRVSKYVSSDFDGKIISFSAGIAALHDFEKNEIVSAIEIDYPKNAQTMGLVKTHNKDDDINKVANVYQAGNHTKVDNKFCVIVEKGEVAYLRMCYKSQDTAESFYQKRATTANEIDVKDIKEHFDIGLWRVSKS